MDACEYLLDVYIIVLYYYAPLALSESPSEVFHIALRIRQPGPG